MKTILIVDDEPTSLELIDFVLKKHHYETILALTATDALSAAGTRKPDLIILDLLMPVMNGSELCERLKSNPETRNIPVLFLSAMVAEKEVEAGFRAGASGFLFKPFESSQVIHKIEEILSSKTARG